MNTINNTKEYLMAKREARKISVDNSKSSSYNKLGNEINDQIKEYERSNFQNRIGDWMATYSGGVFWLLDPRPEEVHIEDIAHALGYICRYNGHISGFYSVAQHSVLVSEHCRPSYALYALLHDAAEAYTGDIISPLKKLLPNYKEIETKIQKAVCKKFGIRLTEKMKKEVKYWDNVLLATEVRDLISYKYLNWKIEVEPLESSVFPLWSPELAEQRFLTRFNRLWQKK